MAPMNPLGKLPPRTRHTLALATILALLPIATATVATEQAIRKIRTRHRDHPIKSPGPRDSWRIQPTSWIRFWKDINAVAASLSTKWGRP
jgi:hypothetical protein